MDTASEPGSWAATLPFCTQIVVKDFDPLAYDLDRRLARRAAGRKMGLTGARLGHHTRKCNQAAQVR